MYSYNLAEGGISFKNEAPIYENERAKRPNNISEVCTKSIFSILWPTLVPRRGKAHSCDYIACVSNFAGGMESRVAGQLGEGVCWESLDQRAAYQTEETSSLIE